MKVKAPEFGYGKFGNRQSRGRSTKVKVTKSMKNDVWDRQKGHCNRGGKRLSMRAVEYDHIKEVQHGGGIGGHKLSNIQALCLNCHGKKTNKTRIKKTVRKRDSNSNRSNNDILGEPLDFNSSFDWGTGKRKR